MKYRVQHLVLTSSIFLFACSTMSNDYAASGSSNGSDNVSTDQQQTANKNNAESISPELLYSLLVAEIALKRGDLDVAVVNYIQAARDTHDVEIARRATRIAEFSQSNEQALEGAELWASIDPEDQEARQALVILLLRGGQLDEASVQLSTLVKNAGEEQGSALMQLVAQLSRERDQESALKLMDMFAAKESDNPHVHFANAHLNMRFNRFTPAISSVDQALRLKSGWLEAIVLRARILQLENKTQEAISYYEQEIKKGDADAISLRISFARLLMDVREQDKALEQYVILSELQPENNDLTYAAGLLSLQAAKNDEAEKYFLRLRNSKERVIEANYYLGQVEELRGNTDKAIEWYSKVRRGELYIDAQTRMAALLSKQGFHDKAIKKVRSIKAYNSRDKLKLYLLEGDVMLEAGRHQDAFDIYDRALLDMPDESNLLYARALSAEKIDRLDILENDLRLILRNEPNNVQALNALGYTLADKTERYEEALRFIKRALALEPKDAAVVDSMGWVQYRMGNHQEALAYLKNAMAIIGDVEIAAHFGEVLWVTNNKEEAIDVWNRALKESPNNKMILDVMRRFGL